MNDKASPLVKFHGVSYGDDGDLPVSALQREFRHRFGGGLCGNQPVRRVHFSAMARPSLFDAPTIKRIDMLVGRYLDRSDDFAAPDIKPCMT